MKLLKLCPLLLSFACTVVVPAAERRVDAAGAVLLAAADPVVLPMHIGTVAVEAKAESAGVAESLPDLPRLEASHSIFRAAVSMTRAVDPRETFNKSLPDSPGVSLIEASPIAGAARRVGAQRFNTEDGSSVNAFAICYRLSKRSSLQVIPGDPAPVKMAVTTMANNMGVTVGMVMRLSKSR